MTNQERMDRVFEACPFGIFLVDANRLGPPDLELLTRAKPGRIILVNDIEAVRFLPTSAPDTLGCVAGWISDEDVEAP